MGSNRRRSLKVVFRWCSGGVQVVFIFELTENEFLMDDFVFIPCGTSRGPGACKAIRVNGRVLSLSFQGEALLGQLAVVGGNKSGVFVHRVTEGSAAHAVGISPGAQIVEVAYEQNQKALRMVLEDSTLEEAMWALGQVTGLCHLSLRPRQDGTTRSTKQNLLIIKE
ncbi:Caspase recruitment domain-containing protein 14 [Liparis tanakae]|uniref:Caspase recruitment domain-containing protein 14 n=1 Tax=Liparis tanakae TaxID=230148 RepID=A0A4Z2E9D6_9TELE|nr:Caspase recruitment domain-containing protein 14 [Liparis tanakae]